jgi:hypothetical protein
MGVVAKCQSATANYEITVTHTYRTYSHKQIVGHNTMTQQTQTRRETDRDRATHTHTNKHTRETEREIDSNNASQSKKLRYKFGSKTAIGKGTWRTWGDDTNGRRRRRRKGGGKHTN